MATSISLGVSWNRELFSWIGASQTTFPFGRNCLFEEITQDEFWNVTRHRSDISQPQLILRYEKTTAFVSKQAVRANCPISNESSVWDAGVMRYRGSNLSHPRYDRWPSSCRGISQQFLLHEPLTSQFPVLLSVLHRYRCSWIVSEDVDLRHNAITFQGTLFPTRFQNYFHEYCMRCH